MVTSALDELWSGFLGAAGAIGRAWEQISSPNATKTAYCSQIACGRQRNSRREHSARAGVLVQKPGKAERRPDRRRSLAAAPGSSDACGWEPWLRFEQDHDLANQ